MGGWLAARQSDSVLPALDAVALGKRAHPDVAAKGLAQGRSNIQRLSVISIWAGVAGVVLGVVLPNYCAELGASGMSTSTKLPGVAAPTEVTTPAT